MKTRDEVLAILRNLKPRLAEKYNVTSIALFGSFARNEQTEASDVDLLLEYSDPPGLEIVDLGDEIEAALGLEVDLVSRVWLKPQRWATIAEDVMDVN